MKNYEHSTGTVRRWLDAFVALPGRLKLPLAILLALLIHVMLVTTVWVAPRVAKLLRLDWLFPEPKKKELVATPTPAPPPTKKPLELASVQVNEKKEVPPPPPALPPPPPKEQVAAAPPPPAAPLTAAELAQLQKLFEALPEEEQQRYIDVEGLARQKNMSQRALYESWRDSVAGTRKPGKNGENLPGQDGRTDLTFTKFANKEANSVRPESMEEGGRNKPLPSVKFPGLEAPPIYKPRPIPKAELAAGARTVTMPAVAAATPAPTPPPPPPASTAPDRTPEAKLANEARRMVEKEPLQYVKLGTNEIPLMISGLTAPKPSIIAPRVTLVPPAPTPPPTPPPVPTPKPVVAKATPAPTPAPTPKPTPAPQQMAKLSTPEPKQVNNAAMHQEKRKIEGKGPEGEGGVDAIATERGKYKRMMQLIVSSRWEPAVKSRRDLIQPGTVSIRFGLDKTGRLVKFKVDYNSSNSAHAMLVEEAMRATQFQPPPPDMLRNGVFEDEFNFTLY